MRGGYFSLLDGFLARMYTGRHKEVFLMIKAGIKEARQNLPALLSKVQEGEEVVITKRGEPVAKVMPFRKRAKGRLESHKSLRDALTKKGRSLSEVVAELRDEERS